MRKIPLLLVAATCGLLASCKSTVAMRGGDLAEVMKASPLGAKRVRLSLQVNNLEGKPFVAPDKVLRMGQDLTIGVHREFVYPTAYTAPVVSGNSVDPATPTKFETIDTGMTATLRAEPMGTLVLLSGKVEVVKFDRFIRMGGEIGQPITDGKGRVITENRVEMPALRTFTTPVYVAVKPGKPTSFEIDGPRKGTRMTLTVNAVN